MRSSASVSALVFVAFLAFLAGCSSAGTLPSGGPNGGDAYDASPGDAQFPWLGSGTGSSGVTTGASSGITTVASSGVTTVATTGVATTGLSTTGVVGTSAVTSTTATSSSSASSAPTWTILFNTYLTDASATIGSCDGGSCHYHSECDTAAACYSWIGSPSAQQQYGPLSNGGGLFTWDMGYMPKGGPTSEPQAEADFAAWIAAGSLGP